MSDRCNTQDFIVETGKACNMLTFHNTFVTKFELETKCYYGNGY